MQPSKYLYCASVTATLVAASACSEETLSNVGESDTATTVQALYGRGVQVEMSLTEGYSAATAALYISNNEIPNPTADTLNCSGTLVNPRTVVTALHCVIPGRRFTRVRFPQRGGVDVPVIQTRIPTGAVASTKTALSSTDIAVLVLGQDVPRWIAQPIPIRTTDVSKVFIDGDGWRHNGLLAGFGGTVKWDSDAGIDGNRRIGTAAANWNGTFWQVGQLDSNSHAVPAKGDSGSGLFRQYSPHEFELVGVYAGSMVDRYIGPFSDDTVYYSEYSPTGNQSATFMQSFKDAMDYIPIEPGPAFDIKDVAVYGAHSAYINDRASIEKPEGGYAKVASGGRWGIEYDGWDLNIGADAKVGDVWVDDNVVVRDRGTTGNIVAEGRLISGNGIKTGSVIEHTRSTMPPLRLPDWPTTATQLDGKSVHGSDQLTEQAGTVITGAITVYSDGVLTIKPSSKPYYIKSLQMEPGSKVLVDTSQGPQRIFIANTFIDRGQLSDTDNKTKGDILIGVYGSDSVHIERPITATVVVPNASLTLDDTGKTFQGAFMADEVTVHQAITVVHYPFPAVW